MSKIISIEGNIGSGKSTLLSFLKKNYEATDNIIFLKEPVDDWESIKDKDNNTMLKKFYENQEKYSFAFQMMAYISRLALLKDTIEKYPNSVIITERCLNTDRYVFAKMLYDNGKLEDVEYQIYLKWFEHFSKLQQIQKAQDALDSADIPFVDLPLGASYREFRTGRGNKIVQKGDLFELCTHEPI
jgi:deoxyadenosine/deoxycytidine kinase